MGNLRFGVNLESIRRVRDSIKRAHSGPTLCRQCSKQRSNKRVDPTRVHEKVWIRLCAMPIDFRADNKY